MLTFAIKKKRTPSIAPKRHAPTVSPMSHSLHLQQAKVRHILRSPTLQAKLTIGAPNDKYEQEADRIAEQVIRMPEPRVERQPEEEEEELIQTKPLAEQITPLVQRQVEPEEKEEEEILQTKEVPGQTSEVTPDLESRIQALRGGGQPLPNSVRAFFEPRFRVDFSRVQVHSNTQAAETAKSINARAYTVGHHVVFGNGQYQPTTGPGRRLLAHELSHTIQQGAVLQSLTQVGRDTAAKAPTHCDPPTVQRKMKFEFQTKNVLWRRRGKKARLLKDTTSKIMKGRKFGPKDYLRKGKSKKGTELQTETGGVIEFETDGWFRKWSKLRAHIEEAVDMVKKIVAKKNLIDPKTLPEEQRSTPRYRWPWKKHQKGAQLNKKTKGWMDSLRKGEKLEVEVKDKDWFAHIQSSEEIELSQYESLLREHEWRSPKDDRYIEPTIKSAQNILDDANKKGIPADELVNLRGLLQIIVNYILRGRNLKGDRVVKATFWLMSRTSFSSIYRSLLNKQEKNLFRLIVKDKKILKELGLNEKTKVFKEGIKGKAHNITVHAWLESIVNPRAYIIKKGKKIWLRDKKGKKVSRDWLSHGLFGVSHAMGAFDVDPEKRTVRFEVRGTRSPRQGVKKFPQWRSIRSQPLKHWVDYAESIFAQAAKCRGTRLDYDQTDEERKKKFTPSKCP